MTKAAQCFGPHDADDNYVGQITSATRVRLLEIKTAQWRGGVWQDPRSGVCWLVVGGLAKGNHQDRDDFYERIKRENASGDPESWLPTEADDRLLKRETAARIRTDWELETQRLLAVALARVCSGGTDRITIHHPMPDQGTLAEVGLSVVSVREVDYEADEIEVEITPDSRYEGTDLLWALTLRLLVSIHPPEQGWDRFRHTFSNIAEPGAFTRRADELARLVENNDLAIPEPGATGHYTHREHLAAKSVRGEAVRALCGVYFVPTQDHEALPACVTCADRLADLPS